MSVVVMQVRGQQKNHRGTGGTVGLFYEH